MACGCGGKRRPAPGRRGAAPQRTVVGYYVDLPDGTQIPQVDKGAKPFLSRFEALAEITARRGGTMREVRRTA